MLSNCGLFVLTGLACLVVCCTACPPPADVKPCECRKNCTNCPSELICKNIQTVEILTSVFYKTKNFPFKDLFLNDSCIPYIPAQGVEEKQFSKIRVENGCLGSVFDRPPTTDLLREISIKNITIRQGFQWELFASLSNFKSLIISDTTVRKLTSQFGKEMPKSIVHIQFKNTKTTIIENGAFSELENLETILIGRSTVRTLSRDMFPKPAKLRAITILFGKVQSLPNDIFDDMPDLRVVIISNNLITKVQQSVFGKILPQLNTLALYNNPIRCDCSIKWIVTQNKHPRHLSAQCKEPEGLKDRQVKHLKLSDFPPC